MKKILVTGANGFIGGFLTESLSGKISIIGTDIQEAGRNNYLSCDLLNKEGVSKLITLTAPDVLIHCAGTKDLFGCEKDPDKAYRLNTETTKNLIDAVREKPCFFVLLSSDYVFDGKKGMYKENDLPNPSTVYGKTKLDCERYVEQLKNYAICRTANVYEQGSKYFDFVIDSLSNNKTIDMYADTYFTPTYIQNLSEMIETIINNNLKGVFHTAGTERTNRYEFAIKIAKHFNKDTNLLKPSSKPKDSPIASDSSLDTKVSIEKLGIKFLSIDEGLECMGRY